MMDRNNEDFEQQKELHEKSSTTLSPVMKSNNNRSPKISVKGDYDQFARQPRKEKNTKTRDRSPVVGYKSKHNSGEKQTQAKIDTERRMSQDNEQFPNVPTSKDSQKRKQSQCEIINQIPAGDHLPNMPVTNFPLDRGEGDSHQTHTISRLDSLPPRKHARVEHMKQLRDEASENNLHNVSSKNMQLAEHKVIATDIHGTTVSHRMAQEIAFTPPVASVVDFLDNKEFRHRLNAFNKNLWENFIQQSERIDASAVKGLSTRYMVRYLGIAEDPRSKNVISSMLVRPILPPIRRKNKRRVGVDEVSSPESDNSHPAPKFEVKPCDHRDPKQEYIISKQRKNNTKIGDMTYHFQRGTRLRQGDSKYVYRPRAHHSTPVLGATTNSPKEVLDIGGEIEDDFDKVIRWKSKIRYCGKPAMYKRTTSPTLGEEALRRKLTDRLPTRQTQKLWPELSELYSELHDQNESWRRPPSNMNPKLSSLGPQLTASNGGGLKARPHRKISIVETGQNSTSMIMDDSSRHHAFGVSLPPPQLPERKRRPMWQRMQK